MLSIDNIMPFIQQALRDMKADKPAAPVTKNFIFFLRGVDIPFYISADFYTGLRLGSLALPRHLRQT